MPQVLLGRVTTLAILVVAVVGVVDALASRTWDLVVTFALVGVLATVEAASSWSRRRPVPIRSDLVRWLEARALASEESAGAVADRAIAAFRAGFVGEPPVGPDRSVGDHPSEDRAHR